MVNLDNFSFVIMDKFNSRIEMVQERGKSSELEVSDQHIDGNGNQDLDDIHLGEFTERKEKCYKVICQRELRKCESGRGRKLCKKVTK